MEQISRVKDDPSSVSFESITDSAAAKIPVPVEKILATSPTGTTNHSSIYDDEEIHRAIKPLSKTLSHNMASSTSTLPTPLSTTNSNPVQPTISTPSKHTIKFYTTIFMLCSVSVMASMDSVIVASCLSAIASDLHGTSVQSFWLGTGFLLTQTVTIPIYGSLSNIFGRKVMILFAIALFFVASIFCAVARSMSWLVVARVVQGFGAGGTLNLVSVIISDITTMRERGKYVSFGAASWAIGSIGGIPLGGAIAEYTTWRWIFWINLPLAVISFAALTWSLHLETDPSSFRIKLARIDYIGMIIFSGATVAFLVGITTGGSVHPWSSASVITPIALGVFLYAFFVLLQWRFLKNPMMPLRLFKDRSAQAAYFVIWSHGLVVWCLSYYMIIFFLGAKQQGRLAAASSVLAGTAWGAPSAVVAGMIVKKTLHFQKTIWFGLFFLTLGTGLNLFMTPTANKGIIYGLRIFGGIGAGVLFPTPMLAVQITQTGEDIGMATSFTAFFRSLGQAFGVALGGVILQNQWTKEVIKKVVDGSIPVNYSIGSNEAEVAYGIINTFPESVQRAYEFVYADSLKTVWWAVTAFSGAALLVGFLIRNESMDRSVVSKQGFVNKVSPGEKVKV